MGGETDLEPESNILVPTTVLSSHLLGRSRKLGVMEERLLLERLLQLICHSDL